jgi:regulator of sirC expression with transglutaminase-like and TPR domain
MWTNSWRALQRGCAADVLELRQLNQFFFQDLNFGGNVNDYYDLTASFAGLLRNGAAFPTGGAGV